MTRHSLLEAHVMNVEDVTTPLRQLYFIVQIMLMNRSRHARRVSIVRGRPRDEPAKL